MMRRILARRRALATGLARLAYWAATPRRLPQRLVIVRELQSRDKLSFAVALRRVLAFRPEIAAPEMLRELSHGSLIERDYERWVELFDQVTDADRHAIRQGIEALAVKPTISVVTVIEDESALALLIASLRAQLYQDWDLAVVEGTEGAVIRPDEIRRDPRIRFVRPGDGSTADGLNEALALTSGDFVAIARPGTVVPEAAFYEIAIAVNRHREAAVLFGDEDKIDPSGERHSPWFKPGFSIDLLFGQNLIGQLGVYRRSLLTGIGPFRRGFEGAEDYDLALRATAGRAPGEVIHIPAVLSHELQPRGLERESIADPRVAARQRALQDFLGRSAGRPPALVGRASPAVPFARVHWQAAVPEPLVTVIIPTRDRADLLRQCLDGLLTRTRYDDLEILIVDNASVEPETLAYFADVAADPRVRVLRIEEPFNYSMLNNRAAREARGSILLLLNNDIDVIGPDWLREMIAVLGRPDVGVVGAKLLYADTRVQHAGVRLGAGSFYGGPGVADHFGLFERHTDPGYFGMLTLARDVGAVTGACLAIRKDVFDAVGGLDEQHLAVAFNDVDLCLRVRAAGHRIVWTPFAELFHLESASRGSDVSPEKKARFDSECQYMIEHWGDTLQHDPFINPALNLRVSEIRLAFPPRREKPWRTKRQSA